MIQIPKLVASLSSQSPPSSPPPTPHNVSWSCLIPPEQWAIYHVVLQNTSQKKIPFALGGGLAFSYYANRWRNTKDIDLYILPEDRERMIDVIHACGLEDYFPILAYDRNWIYRSHKGEIICDIIWQMANYRTQVDLSWLTRGEWVQIYDFPVRLLPPEELMWSKLYVLQRDRCDWGDLLNILFCRGPALDWQRLLDHVGLDQRLLAAVLNVFAWTCPGVAQRVPAFVWQTLQAVPPKGELPDMDAQRIRLLDSRDWFGPNQRHENATETLPGRLQSPR